MRLQIGVRDPAVDLLGVHGARAEEGHDRTRRIAGLGLHHREVHRLGIDARRCAGLQAANAQRQLAQAIGQRDRRRITGAAAAMVFQPDVDGAAEESAGGQHHRLRAEADAGLRDHALDGFAFDHKIVGSLLEDIQIRLILQHGTNCRLVQSTIRLRPRGTHGRALATIEHTKLDTGTVSGQRHGAAKRINFFHQMRLADAADSRVAAHLPQRFDVMREQQCLTAHARRRQCRFRASVAATDNNHIVSLGIMHGGIHSA